jgi:hypothetical protein
MRRSNFPAYRLNLLAILDLPESRRQIHILSYFRAATASEVASEPNRFGVPLYELRSPLGRELSAAGVGTFRVISLLRPLAQHAAHGQMRWIAL